MPEDGIWPRKLDALIWRLDDGHLALVAGLAYSTLRNVEREGSYIGATTLGLRGTIVIHSERGTIAAPK